jgi:hypothetical protein
VRWFARKRKSPEPLSLKPPAERVRFRRVRADLPEIEPVSDAAPADRDRSASPPPDNVSER